MLHDIARALDQADTARDDALAKEPGLAEGVHGSSYPVNNQTINAAATYTTATLRGSFGVPTYAKGVWGVLFGQSATVGASLYADSADDTPDGFSSRLDCSVANQPQSNLCMVRLGAAGGANDGKIKVKAVTAQFTAVYFWVVGYWA